MTKMKKFLRRIALILAVLFALGVLAAAGTNAVVVLFGETILFVE